VEQRGWLELGRCFGLRLFLRLGFLEECGGWKGSVWVLNNGICVSIMVVALLL